MQPPDPRRRLMPQMSELVAFEAAARHGSFTRAAAELHLTQGAVSRAVAALEARLQVRLFDRVRQRVVLTEVGRDYRDRVRAILDQTHQATRQAMAAAPLDATLNLAVLPTFGTYWLAPRLPRFRARHPEVVVNISARIRPFDFAAERFDAAIHHGEPVWPGGIAEHLMTETMLPMCSPAYRDRLAIREPADLARATLLHQSTRPFTWARWHAELGLADDHVYRGPVYDQFGVAAAAAAAGMGVALLPRFLVAQQLEEAKLIRLFDIGLSTGSAYYLVRPETGHKAIVAAFGEWLAEELGEERKAS